MAEIVEIEKREKAISGGKLKYAGSKLAVAEKVTAQLRSTTPGEYVLQVVLPDGTVHELATVDAKIPAGQYARVSARIYIATAPTSDIPPADVEYEAATESK